MKPLSRRTFLRLSAATAAGAMAAASGCTPSAPAAPTATPVPPAPEATATLQPPPTNTAEPPTPTMAFPITRTYNRPELIQFYPAAKSKVVHASDPKVWEGDKLNQALVRGLVDRSILQLTGLKEVKAAWQALFKPDEKIAIKVNVFRNSTIWTHFELVKAVTDSLVEAGIPGEQITVFDYFTDELKTAGYPVNKDGPGVRIFGSDDAYATIWPVGTHKMRLSDILTGCDALINMPVLKSHMMAGMTFAMKNHYGSVSVPDNLHDIQGCIPPLNALPPIKDATRLVIGDILEANTTWSDGWPYWTADVRGDSILMSYDPLAHDTVGLQILTRLAEEKGSETSGILGMSDFWFKTSAKAGLGASDMADIDLVEI
jgi:hypothetical protein